MSLWTKVLRAWLIASVFINVFGVYQIVARAFDLPFAWLEYNNLNMLGRGNLSSIDEVSQLSLRFQNFYRATSVLPEPSALAAFNVLIQIFIIVPFMQRSKPFFKSKLLTATIFISSLIALFLTFSLTGVLGLFLVLGSVFIFEKRIKLKAVLSILSVSVVLIVITDSIVESYSDISVLKLFGNRVTAIVSEREGRKGGMSGESFGTRVESAEQSLEIWYRHPLLGIGMGLTDFDKEAEIGFADFGILSAFSETGIVGGISFLGLFISFFIISFKLMKYRLINHLDDDENRLYGLAYYVVLQLFLINFIVSNNIVNMALWLPAAMIFSIFNSYSEKTDNKAYIIPCFKSSMKLSINSYLNRAIVSKNK
jgi:O-antigen ligase